MEAKNEIILYQPNDSIQLEVRLDEETVWLNRQQIAVLFDRDIKTIGKHINNALREELAGVSIGANFATLEYSGVGAESATTELPATVANFATVQKEGNREVLRNIEYYNLDVILSVGYRVKSANGIKFRAWANQVLKNHMLRGYAVNQRIERLEYRMTENEKKIDFFVKTTLPPVEGIFYEGQIFDAFVFAANLIKSAKKSIALIYNYIDEKTLLLLSKRNAKVEATIYTKPLSVALQADITTHNVQYEPITVEQSNGFHDRFLIIDETVYHIGASLKDLGKKLFAFSKMELTKADILKII